LDLGRKKGSGAADEDMPKETESMIVKCKTKEKNEGKAAPPREWKE